MRPLRSRILDNEKIIEVHGLTKKFKNLTAVNNLELNVYRGDVFGFLGPNGAGKSTTIRMLLSLIKPTGGEMKIFGKSIAKTSDVEIRADSELVVKQLNGDYRIENPKIQQFFIEIWNLKFDFQSVKFKHIPREKNKEADKLVNEALDQEAGTKPLF